MRVTVKIGTVEVTVDRPNIKEADRIEGDVRMTKDVVIPTLHQATKRAKELYQLQIEKPERL